MRDEDLSSAETTPPPQSEHAYRDPKRFSNSSSTYSRSFQSVFSSESVPREGAFSHYRQWSTSSNRPPTANTSIAESYPEEDPADLAAAVGLLSCSYGTPKSGPTAMPSDVPPVPPLPAKYQSSSRSGPFKPFPGYREQSDVEMDDQDDSSDDEHHHGRHDDVDDGMFGKMDA